MEAFLNHALSEVSRQHQALENECRLLRDLLKPWPRKKTLIEDVENTERKSTPAAQAPSEILSYAEQQVDELLRKAEKARHLKSKVKVGVDGVLRLEACIIKNTDVNNCTSQSTSSICMVNDSPVDNKDLVIQNKCKAAPSRVPSPQTESLSKQAREIHLSRPAKNLPKRNAIITKNTSATMERSKESKQENIGRPHSHKPSSSRTRHIPAHMLAPFKTSNSIRLPKRKNNHLSENSSSTRVAVKTSLSVGAKVYKTLPEIAARDSKKVVQTSGTYECPVTRNSDPRSDCVNELSFCHNNNTNIIEGSESTHCPDSHVSAADAKPNGSSVSDLKATVDKAPEYSSNCTQSKDRGQSSQNVAETQSNLQENELQQFSLQKNGSSIKLPNKLIKLVHTNQSVREKLSAAKLTKKISTVLPAQQFVDRLCAEDDISPELRTSVSALTCLRSHQMLLDTLQGLHMDQLSESSSTEVLYRAKRTLEFVLTVFAELQEDANYLSQVKYRHAAPVAEISRQCVHQKVTFWLDTGQKRDFQHGCWEHLQTSKLWSHLKFTEKYLKLHISLVKAVLAEWWEPLLENRDLSVFQGVYGLLTSHGQFLPALVENPV